MNLKFLCISAALCAAAFADDAKLRGGNILSCETWSYKQLIRDGKLDMTTIPALYEKEGIKGISYNDAFFKTVDDAYIDQVKEAVKKADRVVTNYVIEGNFVMADEAKRRAQIEDDKKKIRAAHRLGAPLVRINVGSTGKEDADDTLGVERAIAGIKELIPVAQELKMKISIENHGGVSMKAERILKIIQGTDPKYVGALIDFGNFPDDVRYESVALLAPYALTTHVKIREFDDKGESKTYDFPRVLEMLKKARFKGPISIECEGQGDPMENVRLTKALILKYW
jgi:sugar phosphate isomerase/epimerase